MRRLPGLMFTPLFVRYMARLHGADHVADGEHFPDHRVSGVVVRFTFHGWRVVGPDGSCEAILIIDLKHSHHVRRAVIVECLTEVLARSGDVAEVDEEDLFLTQPLFRQALDVLAHGLEVRLTKRDAIYRARHDVEHASVIGGARENPSDAAKRRNRRIVRVQRHLHANVLGDRDHRFQEVFEVGPDRVLAHSAPLGESPPSRRVIVELADEGAASLGYVYARAIPAKAGHPVVADHWNADFSERFDGRLIVVDFLIATGQSELDLLGGHRVAFDARDREARCIEVRRDPRQGVDILVAPNLAQGVADADDGVVYADLPRQPESLVLPGPEQF